MSRTRAEAAIVALLAIFAVLGLRLFYVQVVAYPRYREAADSQHYRLAVDPARRGDILFADGSVAATTLEATTIFAIPREMAAPPRKGQRPVAAADAARLIARALTKDAAWADGLARRFANPLRRNYAVVDRLVDPVAMRRVAALDIPGVHFEEVGRRFYPGGTLAAHVLGYTHMDGWSEGIEHGMGKALGGTDGERRWAVDGLGRPISGDPGERITPAIPGETVRLTIDPTLQHYAEEALGAAVDKHHPRGAWIVVLSVPDARVLALASAPGFDPNSAVGRTPERTRNRAVCDYYEPGSTFKPIVIARAISLGTVSPEESVFCENGRWNVRTLLPKCGRVVSDVHPYGLLQIADVIAKSSNIGMTKIGIRMGRQALRQTLVDFGFGQPTGIEVPGEAVGRVTSAAKWDDYSTTSVPYGQEVGVTGVQLAAAFQAIAAKGEWRAPRLIEGPAPPARRVVSPEAAATTLRFMERVVTDGTGTTAAVKGYRIAGKTGTAQKRGPDGKPSHSLFVGSFCAIAPADAPRVVVLVQLDEPHNGYYGGAVAAPAVKQFLERAFPCLGVRPEAPR